MVDYSRWDGLDASDDEDMGGLICVPGQKVGEHAIYSQKQLQEGAPWQTEAPPAEESRVPPKEMPRHARSEESAAAAAIEGLPASPLSPSSEAVPNHTIPPITAASSTTASAASADALTTG